MAHGLKRRANAMVGTQPWLTRRGCARQRQGKHQRAHHRRQQPPSRGAGQAQPRQAEQARLCARDENPGGPAPSQHAGVRAARCGGHQRCPALATQGDGPGQRGRHQGDCAGAQGPAGCAGEWCSHGHQDQSGSIRNEQNERAGRWRRAADDGGDPAIRHRRRISPQCAESRLGAVSGHGARRQPLGHRSRPTCCHLLLIFCPSPADLLPISCLHPERRCRAVRLHSHGHTITGALASGWPSATPRSTTRRAARGHWPALTPLTRSCTVFCTLRRVCGHAPKNHGGRACIPHSHDSAIHRRCKALAALPKAGAGHQQVRAIVHVVMVHIGTGALRHGRAGFAELRLSHGESPPS